DLESDVEGCLLCERRNSASGASIRSDFVALPGKMVYSDPTRPSTQVVQGDGLQIRYSWVRIPPRPLAKKWAAAAHDSSCHEMTPPAAKAAGGGQCHFDRLRRRAIIRTVPRR